MVKKGFYIAESGRPGPVLIDIPKDVQQEVSEVTFPELIRIRGYSPHIDPDIEHAAASPLDEYGGLTTREREVLQLVAEGHTNAQIAARLFISPRTVETHRANLMRKLTVHSVAQLVRIAIREGLVGPA